MYLLGRAVSGVQGVSYTVKQEKEFIYGQGEEPRAIQSGNKSYEGELKLLQSELEALLNAAPQRALTALTFDLIVQYISIDGEHAGQVVIDTLKNCQVSEVPKAMEQGDKRMEVTLPFMFLGIKGR